MSKIGYARVSTKDQNLNSQIDTLNEYGCERIFSEKVSDRKYNRTELDKCLDYLREGDILIITKLDSLGRTTKQLKELAQYLERSEINLVIKDMNINTKDANGEMFSTMMGAFAEQEGNLLSERTKKGLNSARSRGRMGGRPRLSKDKRETVISLYESKKYTINEIIRMTGVSKSTIYNIVNSQTGEEIGEK